MAAAVFLNACRVLHGSDCWTEHGDQDMGRAYYADGPLGRIEIVEFDGAWIARRDGTPWELPAGVIRDMATEIELREAEADAALRAGADPEPFLRLVERRSELASRAATWGGLAIAAVAALCLLLYAIDFALEHL